MAFSNAPDDKLYGLLPAHIRERYLETGDQLRALLRIIETSTYAIAADLEQLKANAFIETCEPWAVPYIGDLVGWLPIDDGPRTGAPNTADELFRDLAGPMLAPPPPARARADVAKTIYYRRRKGTLPMLEELARDVTGWSAHAVEFFELLGWTQWVRNHLRPHSVRTPDIRSVERMTRLGGPFDEIAHTVDVRPISQREGWHNIRNIGFFLWRLLAHRLENTQARRFGAAGLRFHFSVLGQDAPLFSRARREGDEAGLATELHVPQPIRPARLFSDLQAYQALTPPRPGFTDFYGLFDAVPGFNVAPAPSFAILVDGAPVAADDIRCANLAGWSGAGWSPPAGALVAVDPVRGRLALGTAFADVQDVRVFHHAGFPADLGGGPYRRRAWAMRRNLVNDVYVVNATGAQPTVAAAVAQWAADGGRDAIIIIADNRTYAEALAIDVGPASGALLAIEAADGFRPHLRLEGPLAIIGDRDDFTLTLSGLLIEGTVDLQGSLRRLRLIHSTLVPGISIAEPDAELPPAPPTSPPSLTAAALDVTGAPANTELAVELAFAITGALHVPAHAEAIRALDSIIDGTGQPALRGPQAADAPSPPLHLERCTVRGPVAAGAITLATETIFDGPVMADRVGIGCVRFSWVQPGSRTPRRYRCQPDLAEARALGDAPDPLAPAQRDAIVEAVRRRIRPAFTDDRYGQPAYLQLTHSTPIEIAQGAEDGAEMGVYAHLRQPQRAANLRTRLEEYLPFGLEPGLIYVT